MNRARRQFEVGALNRTGRALAALTHSPAMRLPERVFVFKDNCLFERNRRPCYERVAGISNDFVTYLILCDLVDGPGPELELRLTYHYIWL